MAAKPVQIAQNENGAAGPSVSLTLPFAPKVGNSLVILIGARSNNDNVTGITQTGVTWTSADIVNDGNGVVLQIWSASNIQAGAGTSITVNLSDSDATGAIVREYRGTLLLSSVLDKTALDGATGTDARTGTTGALDFSPELCVGGVMVATSGGTISSPQNGYALVTEQTVTGLGSGRIGYLDKTEYETGISTDSGVTLSSSLIWVGCLATYQLLQGVTTICQARKTADQTSTSAFADITFETDDILIGGIERPASDDFRVPVSGIYKVSYFLAASGAPVDDVNLIGRCRIDDSTVIDQSHTHIGHNALTGRRGIGHSFLVGLSAREKVTLQGKVNPNGDPDFGGSFNAGSEASGDGGEGISTFSIELVDEFYPIFPHIQLHKTASQTISASFADVTWQSTDTSEQITLTSSTDVDIIEPGLYQVSYFLAVTDGGSSDNLLLGQCQKNGSLITQSQAHVGWNGAVGRNAVGHTFIEQFDSGDVIKLRARWTIPPGTSDLGGQTTLNAEAVCSMSVLKVSEPGVFYDGEHDTEVSGVSQTALPPGWSEAHSDSTPVQWHINNNRAARGSQSWRYANDSANNYEGAGTNDGTATSPNLTFPTLAAAGYSKYQLLVSVFADVNTGDEDEYEIRIRITAAIEQTIIKEFLGAGNTGGAFTDTLKFDITASIGGTSDTDIQFSFDTFDALNNTTEGVYFDNLRIIGIP